MTYFFPVRTPVFLALCFFFALPTLSYAAQQDDAVAVIRVSGQGTAAVAPDMAILNMTVTREADTARRALDANSRAMSDVLAAMGALGVQPSDMQTSNFSIQPKYVYPSSKSNDRNVPRIVGYTVRNSLTVRVRDIEKVGSALDQSVSLGVNEGGNIRFTNDDPSAAMTQARIEAVKAAREKAATLAHAAGVEVGDIREISEQSHAPRHTPMARADLMMARGAESVPVAAGENSYRVVVNITFEIDQ